MDEVKNVADENVVNLDTQIVTLQNTEKICTDLSCENGEGDQEMLYQQMETISNTEKADQSITNESKTATNTCQELLNTKIDVIKTEESYNVTMSVQPSCKEVESEDRKDEPSSTIANLVVAPIVESIQETTIQLPVAVIITKPEDTITAVSTEKVVYTAGTVSLPLQVDDTGQNELQNDIQISHNACEAQQEQQRLLYEEQLEQLRALITQKDNMLVLFQREREILEREKQSFRKEMENANREKESTVIKFAIKEKLLLDAKKEKDLIEKHLAEARKEVKNVSTRFQALNEEKTRIIHIMDEKCNEVRKYQRECEKLKTEYGHLESKLKYHVNKLNLETEAKQALEKKLEEERNAPNKLEEKANEKLRMEFEANTILLKHEITRKTEIVENLTKEHKKSSETIKHLQEQLCLEMAAKTKLSEELEKLQEDHNSVQNSYSNEILNSAKLRGQLDELQLLKTQNTLNEQQIRELKAIIEDSNEKLQDNAQDLKELHAKEQELLSINKEMMESIVTLQNEICLLKSKVQGIEAENEILNKEKLGYDTNKQELENKLKDEIEQKNEERQILAKHLSEKTKLYEITKMKLENIMGDFEATNNKHSTVVKELQREIQKYQKSIHHASSSPKMLQSNIPSTTNGYNSEQSDDLPATQRTHSRNSSYSGNGSRRPSESSESETVASSATAVQNDLQGPTKKHLVERILRLQQASARQTEKIDFLENHTLSLVSELQKKSKVVQYYMLRDQAGALTSIKSDQNKSDLAKYGNGVMSAIYGGIKGDNKSMSLELSLEINKKLQAVLEDTLLKNITLKENLDVLGLEVDNLTRKLRQMEAKE
ncbi:coiled-coil domain-containing protein 186-like [Teleopsis dalmanni]|uniref:coiled-coil domain-containing protein 186-like n=1 Tax=Teleopsis dalmanni TaxID=139649 RepID=UPI0018CDCB2D|nr:coiled-coil domain-containing protein 186-like [Teleopsis dalmanni]